MRSEMSEFLINMDDDAALDVVNVGGKAAALARLVRQGFAVPPFMVLRRQAFDQTGLKPEAMHELNAALATMGGAQFAVRSSAVDEDGADHSHAGQFETILNVEKGGITEAAFKVWKSGEHPDLEAYREAKNIKSQDPHPAVLIQAMLAPRAAGVAFAADPISGRQDRFVISAVAGVAEALVSGEIDGETYILDAETGAVLEGDAPLLSADDLLKLAELCRQASGVFGAPQDIEWAFVDDQLYLLQSRPITTKLRPKPFADDNVIVFDNSNIIESYPGFVSPLTFSFAQYSYARVYRQFVALLGVSATKRRENSYVFDNMLSRIEGRVYYNLLNWYRALALLPGFSLNRTNMETMMGVDEPLPEAIASKIGPPEAKGAGRLLERGKLVWVGFRLFGKAMFLGRTNRAFMRRLESALSGGEDRIATLPLSALAGEYRAIEAQVLDQWDAPLINDFLCMMAFGGSRKLMEKYWGEAGIAAHNEILIGQGDIVSAEPAQRLRKIAQLVAPHEELRRALAIGDDHLLAQYPEVKAEIDGYLNKFKDRCTEELKLESVTLDRDPTPLYAAIAAAASQGGIEHAPSSDNAAFDEKLEGKPIRRALMKPLLHWTKHRVRDRENLRFERTRIFGRARRIFRAIGAQFYAGGLLEDAEDIFMLTVSEVLGAIEGFAVSTDLRAIVAERKAEFARDQALPDRGSRFIVNGSMIGGLRRAEAQPLATGEKLMERKGIACSAGEVTAKARPIHDPKTERLENGEILIAKHTDPGWIAVFSNASAIVVERGSLLSHSAIVARELGIPCVVGIKGAMDWLTSGETITVNGTTGVVKRQNEQI